MTFHGAIRAIEHDNPHRPAGRTLNVAALCERRRILQKMWRSSTAVTDRRYKIVALYRHWPVSVKAAQK